MQRVFFHFMFVIVEGVLQEARQAIELMHRWATIDIADALELLSPVFESEEVYEFLSFFLVWVK